MPKGNGVALATMLVPTYRQMLGCLTRLLDKAREQHGAEHVETLLAARLAPDMFPLATQLRFCCVQALEGVSRLAGTECPPQTAVLLEEGRNAGDHPGTLAEAHARIAETLEWIEGIDPATLDCAPSSAIAHELPNGMVFDFTAEQYVRDWALPQFNFHLMAAYAILRNQGVELGKADYVAHLFPLLRADTVAG